MGPLVWGGEEGDEGPTNLPRSFCDGLLASSFMIFPLQAGDSYVPPEMSKKSTPASSSHLMTTHCSAKLWPPSITIPSARRQSDQIRSDQILGPSHSETDNVAGGKVRREQLTVVAA